jgi:hypothetical protein
MRFRLLSAVLFAVAIQGVIIVAAPSERVGAESNPHGESWVGGRVYQGEAIDVDLPESQQIVNIPSRVGDDGRPATERNPGSGMCVTSSAEMAFLWAGEERMRGFRDWAASEPGGADRAKLDDQIARFCAAKGIAIPPYVQYEGPDPQPVMEAALRSGRAVGGTYGWSPRYKVFDRRGQPVMDPRTGKQAIEPFIAHMALYVKAGTGNYVAVLDDNFCGPPEAKHNFPGGSQAIEWMSPQTAVHRAKWPMRSAWLFIPLSPPPPPSPRN